MQQNEVRGESPNNQNEDILEIPGIFKNHSASNYSVPSEFKGVFNLLEIDIIAFIAFRRIHSLLLSNICPTA